MTAGVAVARDGAGFIGHGIVEKFDCDKLAWAIRKNKVRRFTSGDGSLRDGMRAVRLRQLSLKQVLAGERPSLWVPRDELVLLAGLTPDEVTDAGYNLFTTVGVTRLWNLWAAQGGLQAYDATHTRIGAGDTNTAAAVGNTDLAAAVNAANRYFQLADGVPTISSSPATASCKYTSTFASGNGNFAWAEWAIDQGTSSAANAAVAPLFNRAVAALGTKTSAASWAFSATLSIA